MAKQKELITGTAQTATIDQENLPRQNNDRENAILGAQGLSKLKKYSNFENWIFLVEEDVQGDWLDRFYTLIRVGLILMTLYNYNSSGKLLAKLRKSSKSTPKIRILRVWS